MSTTFRIMNSDGSEEPGAGPMWILVDDEDSMTDGVPHDDDDSILDAIQRFTEAGKLPANVEITGHETLDRPYTWQIDPYRWTLTSA